MDCVAYNGIDPRDVDGSPNATVGKRDAEDPSSGRRHLRHRRIQGVDAGKRLSAPLEQPVVVDRKAEKRTSLILDLLTREDSYFIPPTRFGKLTCDTIVAGQSL